MYRSLLWTIRRDSFSIVTRGLQKGDRIIAEGANNLKDGTEIKPIDANAESIYRGLD